MKYLWRQGLRMAIFAAIVTMALLGVFTMWLPWAAGRSDVLDRLIDIVGIAGQLAPMVGHETLPRSPARRTCSDNCPTDMIN